MLTCALRGNDKKWVKVYLCLNLRNSIHHSSPDELLSGAIEGSEGGCLAGSFLVAKMCGELATSDLLLSWLLHPVFHVAPLLPADNSSLSTPLAENEYVTGAISGHRQSPTKKHWKLPIPWLDAPRLVDPRGIQPMPKRSLRIP